MSPIWHVHHSHVAVGNVKFHVALNVAMLQVYTLEELTMVADLCKKHDVLVFADEVYEWLIYKPNKHLKIGGCIGRLM